MAEKDTKAQPQQSQRPGEQTGSPQQPPAAATSSTVDEQRAAAVKAQQDAIDNDPHVHEAIPGAKGIEAVGSGQPLSDKALEGMRERFEQGVPEPPKVGPVPNTDLYLTPGGYQVTPAGVKPSEVGPGTVVSPTTPLRGTKAGKFADEVSEHVAGPGARTAK